MVSDNRYVYLTAHAKLLITYFSQWYDKYEHNNTEFCDNNM